MISVTEALETILSKISPLGTEEIPLTAAIGRSLGEDIRSKRDHPPSNNSAMDGYALRYEDVKNATEESPASIKIIGEQPAGYDLGLSVAHGEAAKIMTGAIMPKGADTVVQVEHTCPGENGFVLIQKAPKKYGLNVRLRGENIREGEIVLKRGTEINAPQMGLLASLGLSRISAYGSPTVSILATGDELVDLDVPPAPHQIVNTNNYLLTAQVGECGATAIDLGIAKDNEKDIEEKLLIGCRSDILISSGGVSVGNFDFVKMVLERLGSELAFWKVAIKPGKPLVFGNLHGKLFFGLPGNPVASFIAFHQFVRPALRKLGGFTQFKNRYVQTRLNADLYRKMDGRTVFLVSNIQEMDGEYIADPFPNQSSGNVKSLCDGNGFIVLSGEKSDYKKGDRVRGFFY